MAKIATREAYGKALAELVSENENIVVLDADLRFHKIRHGKESGAGSPLQHGHRRRQHDGRGCGISFLRQHSIC